MAIRNNDLLCPDELRLSLPCKVADITLRGKFHVSPILSFLPLFPEFSPFPKLLRSFLMLDNVCTVVQNTQELKRKYWATRSSVCSFACTIHSFTCSALLDSLALSAALIRSLARSLTHSRAHGKVYDSLSNNDLVLYHSGLVRFGRGNSTPINLPTEYVRLSV